MNKLSRLIPRAVPSVCITLLAGGIAPQRMTAEDAPATVAATAPADSGADAQPAKEADAGGKDAGAKRDPLTAASLSAEMHKAIASIVIATQSSTTATFDQKSKEEKPFWTGLKDASTALDAMDKALAAKDQKTYLPSESDAGRGISLVNAAWKLLRKNDNGVEKGLVALNRSYRMYDEHYGTEAARRRDGGELTVTEKARLEKLRIEQAELNTKLKVLRHTAMDEKNKVALEMVADLGSKSRHISKSTGESVDNYTHDFTLAAEEADEFEAYNTILTELYPKALFTTIAWPTLDSDRAAISSYYSEFQSTEFSSDLTYTKEPVTNIGDYYSVIVDVPTPQVASTESYSEAYSEDTATEDNADEETSVESDETGDAAQGDEASVGSSNSDSLDDEGNSEQMEANDEPDAGDASDASNGDDNGGDDDSDDNNGGGGSGSIVEPSRVVMVAEISAAPPGRVRDLG